MGWKEDQNGKVTFTSEASVWCEAVIAWRNRERPNFTDNAKLLGIACAVIAPIAKREWTKDNLYGSSKIQTLDELMIVSPEGQIRFPSPNGLFKTFAYMADDLRLTFWKNNEAEILEWLRRIPA